MLKFFILTIIALASMESASSLNCLATDIENLISNRRVVHREVECGGYMNTKMQSLGLHLPPGEEMPEPLCFTANVATNDPSTDFVVKGCAPLGYCKSLVDGEIRKQAKGNGVSVTNVQCSECGKNRCNK